MIWFTSDMYLGHEKALDFTCRPWNQIDEMNEEIIANINEKVKENDELYILGDYSFKITALEAAALRKKIYCKKVHLVQEIMTRTGITNSYKELLLLNSQSQY